MSLIFLLYRLFTKKTRIGICVILYFKCLSQDIQCRPRRDGYARCFTKDEFMAILKCRLSGRLSRVFANNLGLNCSIVY